MHECESAHLNERVMEQYDNSLIKFFRVIPIEKYVTAVAMGRGGVYGDRLGGGGVMRIQVTSSAPTNPPPTKVYCLAHFKCNGKGCDIVYFIVRMRTAFFGFG